MIQVRRSNYRGEDGWTISGKLPGGSVYPVSIFTPHSECAARIIAERVKRGLPWTFAEVHALADGAA